MLEKVMALISVPCCQGAVAPPPPVEPTAPCAGVLADDEALPPRPGPDAEGRCVELEDVDLLQHEEVRAEVVQELVHEGEQEGVEVVPLHLHLDGLRRVDLHRGRQGPRGEGFFAHADNRKILQ